MAVPALIISLTALTPTLHAQTYSVIYNFTGGQDGASPSAGLNIDNAGDLYGTAFSGGNGFGTVFSLAKDNGSWLFRPIYVFGGGSDGAGPTARVVTGPDGAIYGSTSAGGGGSCVDSSGFRGCGTVYRITPPPRAPSSVVYNWSSNTIHSFSGNDGASPQGDLTFDSSGNIYGTTIGGGDESVGVIYSLTQSNGGWSQNLLYQVQGNGDGEFPWGGVVFDASGNLYGVFADNGPYGYGAIYKLSPSGAGWTESTVHGFTFHGSDGAGPQGGFVFDSSGNMYGTTVHDSTGGGTIFELAPDGGGLSYGVIYGLTGGIDLGPYDKLLMDSSGNLYGTTFGDGQYGYGSVFKLTRTNGGWSYTSLHDFTGGEDGGNPICKLVVDASGNLYGTASGGGEYGQGVVFEVTR
jgi:uncharacterized repeat protein (TIGR03803 family)